MRQEPVILDTSKRKLLIDSIQEIIDGKDAKAISVFMDSLSPTIRPALGLPPKSELEKIPPPVNPDKLTPVKPTASGDDEIEETELTD